MSRSGVPENPFRITVEELVPPTSTAAGVGEAEQRDPSRPFGDGATGAWTGELVAGADGDGD